MSAFGRLLPFCVGIGAAVLTLAQAAPPPNQTVTDAGGAGDADQDSAGGAGDAGQNNAGGAGGAGHDNAGGADPSIVDAASSALATRIAAAITLTAKLTNRVRDVRLSGALSASGESRFEEQVAAWANVLRSIRQRLQPPIEEKRRNAEEAAATKDLESVEKALEALGQELDALQQAKGWSLIGTLLEARCSTAICFDNGSSKNWLGIEPLVELPIGKSFAVGRTSLSDWVNNHDLRVDLAAGIRVWLFRDVVSVSLYLSQPLNDEPVRLKGSSFVYPSASVRRPYPGIALGLLFDSIWLGFDRDELRNGDGQDSGPSGSGSFNPEYPPNEVISSAWTLTLALQPVTAFRTAIGTAVQANKGGAR